MKLSHDDIAVDVFRLGKHYQQIMCHLPETAKLASASRDGETKKQPLQRHKISTPLVVGHLSRLDCFLQFSIQNVALALWCELQPGHWVIFDAGKFLAASWWVFPNVKSHVATLVTACMCAAAKFYIGNWRK